MKSKSGIIGIASWGVAIVSVFLLLRTEMQAQSSSVSALSSELGAWLTSQHTEYTAKCVGRMWVGREDPIFLEIAPGQFRQVGHVVNTDGSTSRDPKPVGKIQVEIYDEALAHIDGAFELQFHSASLSLDNVVKTMLPKERREEIAGLIQETWEEEREEILDRLQPILREGVRTAFNAVEQQLPEVLKRHEEDFRRIADRYEVDIVKADLLPLVKEQILPIIEEEAVPVAKDIGKQLWKKVSLISFAWRFMYDKSPLPKRDAVKVEFQRFVDQEVIPTLKSRTDELLDVTESIVKRSMKNPEVRTVLKKNFKQVAEDKELHRLIWSVVKEAVVENELLKDRLEFHFRNERTRSAFEDAGEEMETMVRAIGDALFGSRETGITPEFSRILRVQLLTKDRRWFMMVPVETAAPTKSDDSPDSGKVISMKMATESMIYPMGFGGSAQSPLTPQG
ncbi:MAG: hypothetical protein ABJZ55_01770 [Fuerstiella sp.]